MKLESVKNHFNLIAPKYDTYTKKRPLHYSTLKQLVRKYLSKNKVLEVGCGTGDILASLNTKSGAGYDISPEMIKVARKKYSKNINLHFTSRWPNKKFDYIFMTDVVEHLDDRQKMFSQISRNLNKNGRFLNVYMNPVWQPVERVYTLLGLKMPEGPHRRVSFKTLKKEVQKEGLVIMEHGYKLLIPIYIPLLSSFANRFLEKYLKKLCFIEYFCAVKA